MQKKLIEVSGLIAVLAVVGIIGKAMQVAAINTEVAINTKHKQLTARLNQEQPLLKCYYPNGWGGLEYIVKHYSIVNNDVVDLDSNRVTRLEDCEEVY